MPGLHIDKQGGGGSAYYNDPKNYVVSNYVDIKQLMADGKLEPERKYLMTDYLHKYFISGSNSDGIVRYLQTYDYIYGYATFGFYVYDLPVGKEVFVTGLPEGYAGAVKVGDRTTVSVNSQNWYFQFANGIHTIRGVKFKLYKKRFNNITEGEEYLDANGRPVIVPGGILNTQVHDGAAYMDMTAEENLAVVPEQLLFTAETAHSFKREVESATFVGDIVHYNFENTQIHNDNQELLGTRNGFITYRKNDALAIDLPIDWRNARFRRWQLNLDSRTKLLNQHLDVNTTKLGYQGKWLYTAGKRKVTEPQYFYVAPTVEGHLPNLDANAQKTTFAYITESPVSAKDYPVFPLDKDRSPKKELVSNVKAKMFYSTVFQCLTGESNSPLSFDGDYVAGSTFVGTVSLGDPASYIYNHTAIDAYNHYGNNIRLENTASLSYIQIGKSNQASFKGVVFATMQNGVRLSGVDQPLPVVWWIYVYANNSTFINGAISGVTPHLYLDNTKLLETSLFGYYSPTHPNVANDSEYMREVFKFQSGVFSKVTVRFLNVVDRVVLDTMLFKDHNPNTASGISLYDFTAPLYSKVLKLDPETFTLHYENSGKIVSYSSGAAPSESPIYTGILRIKNVVLAVASWVLNEVTGLYEFSYENQNILLSREVEIAPDSASLPIAIAAKVSRFTTVAAGTIKIYAEVQPASDITVNILIEEAKDL